MRFLHLLDLDLGRHPDTFLLFSATSLVLFGCNLNRVVSFLGKIGRNIWFCRLIVNWVCFNCSITWLRMVL